MTGIDSDTKTLDNKDASFYKSSYANMLIFGLGATMAGSSGSMGELSNTSNITRGINISKIAGEIGISFEKQNELNETEDIPNEILNLSYPIEKSKIVDKVDKFSELEEGWNGFGSETIDNEVISKAKDLILKLQGLPRIYPTGRNSIQIEYEDFNTGNYVELEIFLSKVICFYENEVEGEYDEFEVDDIQAVNQLINKLNVA